MRINLKITYLPLVLVIYFITCPIYVIAAEKGQVKGDSSSEQKVITITGPNQLTCYESAKYLVVAKEIQEGLGTDFLIKYKSKPGDKLSCNYVSGSDSFEIKNDWAEYFAGLKKDLLIFDSTTGPGPSGLTIWDLRKRKIVFKGSWYDPEESNDDTLVYWLETGEATDNNCPQLKEWKLQGLEAAIETKVTLNLSNFEISRTRQTRCSSRQ